MKLSIVLLSHNEAPRLEKLLPLLSFAEDVVVIDDDSTDNTAEVSEKYGARVYKRKLAGDYAAQRNFGLSKAIHDWVLFLDPDETPSKKLIEEIETAIQTNEFDGYLLKRRDIFLGKRLRFGETGHMSLVRLGKKTAGTWERSVHEVWEIQSTGILSSPLIHESHPTIQGFFQKIRRYAELEAEYRNSKTMSWSFIEMLTYPLLKFFYTFLWQRGFLDGWRGLVMSLGMSWHSFLVRWYGFQKTFLHPHTYWYIAVIRVLVLGVVCSIPLGQLTRIQYTDSTAFYLFELLMVLVVGWMSGLLVWKQNKVQLTVVSRSLLAFSSVLALSLCLNLSRLGQEFVSPFLYLGRWWLYTLFYIASEQAILLGYIPYGFKRLLVWLGGIASVFGLIGYVLWPDARFLYFLGWDDHYFRLLGPYLDPAFTGLLLVLYLVVLEFRSGWITRLGYVLGLIALALTFSRSSYLVYIFMIVYLAWKRKEVTPLLTKLALFLAIILVLPKPGGEGVNLARTYSVESRAESVMEGKELFLGSPVFGIGFNAYKAALVPDDRGLPVHPSGPDNSFMLVLVTSGLVGLGVFIGLWWMWLKAAWSNQLVFTSLVVIGLHSLTNNSFFYPFVLLWMFVLWWRYFRLRLLGIR